MKKIGLALGGGGAKGFAHIPILEVFDELGIKPYCITGTSVGAIMGALYASGHSAKDIADMLGHLLTKSENSSLKDFFRNKEMFKFLQLIDPQFSLKPKGLIKGDKLLGFLTEQLQVSTFKELKIPLKVVATDFWNKQQVVFESGELLPAVRASMALPYIFTPVILDGQVLVDGGLVNNVPHDLLSPKCDIRIAVDITGNHTEPKDRVPTPMDAVFHTYSVMRDAMSQEKRSNHPVDIYLEPPLVDIDMFDFHKADTIYRQGLGAKDDFKRKLDRLISNKRPLSGWLRKT
ncbi:MAG: patatin-like phospholipase family protein [Kiritimatiellales bacterium]|nr:patatin-like phospholipase family protein [Pontiella sp.]NNJ70977.1 patatin-like phospholipase family protein [Kiritimatiellales bacterium]